VAGLERGRDRLVLALVALLALFALRHAKKATSFTFTVRSGSSRSSSLESPIQIFSAVPSTPKMSRQVRRASVDPSPIRPNT
jgi:hypothetical protein